MTCYKKARPAQLPVDANDDVNMIGKLENVRSMAKMHNLDFGFTRRKNLKRNTYLRFQYY